MNESTRRCRWTENSTYSGAGHRNVGRLSQKSQGASSLNDQEICPPQLWNHTLLETLHGSPLHTKTPALHQKVLSLAPKTPVPFLSQIHLPYPPALGLFRQHQPLPQKPRTSHLPSLLTALLPPGMLSHFSLPAKKSHQSLKNWGGGGLCPGPENSWAVSLLKTKTGHLSVLIILILHRAHIQAAI